MIASFFSSLVPSFTNASLENPAFSLNDPRALEYLSGGTQSEAGVVITPRLALMVPAFFQAMSIISGDIGGMPLNVHKRDRDDDRSIDENHPAEYLTSVQPNDEMCAFEFWRRLELHTGVYGNGYAYIGREGRVGEPYELLNLLPDRTAPARTARGELYYVTEVDGKLESLHKEEVLHIKGMSLDSVGLHVSELARNTLGLSLAAEGFASKFFANGSQMGGILEVPPAMTPKAADNLEEGWRKRTSGKDNWFRTIVLRDGAKFHGVTIDPQKSQLNELREEQVRDVARFTNMPGFKLGLADSVSYNSLEQAQKAYLMGCLWHRMCAIVGECTIKLLTEKQRRKNSHYFEYNTSVLLEADFKTLNEALEIQRRNEVISANEWRRKINLNKRTDPGGDEYINPNTRAREQAAKSEPATEPEKPSNMLPKLKAKLAEDINCMAKRVCFNARDKSKDQGKFVAWLDGAVASNQRVFDEKLKSTVSLVAEYLNCDENPLFCSVSGRFFSEFTAKMDVKAAGPTIHKAVSEACDSFEQTISSTIENLVFGDS